MIKNNSGDHARFAPTETASRRGDPTWPPVGVINWLLITLLVLLMGGGTMMVHGQNATPTPTEPFAPVLQCPPNCDALAAKVQQFGALYVIARLSTPFAPENTLAATDLTAQRAAIADAQNGLIAGMSPYAGKLAGYGGYQLTIMSPRSPFVLLQVDQTTLAALTALSMVETVYEDVPHSQYFDLGLSGVQPDTTPPAVSTPGATPFVAAGVVCPPQCADLRAKAAGGHPISVIVTLKIDPPYYLEPQLTAPSKLVQRAAIRLAQAKLLTALPTAKVQALFYIQPTLTLTVDAVALDALIGSPLVAALAENGLVGIS